MKRLMTAFIATVLAVAAGVGAAVVPASAQSKKAERADSRVRVPLNLAVLVQDDLEARVGNELKVTRQFISSLPAGSRVMVGYIRSGSLQVRQPFTDNLEQAGRALRMPVGSTTVSPYSPFIQVRDALKQFPEGGQNRNAVLLVSDGLDTSRGFDYASTVHSVDLDRAAKMAKEKGVAVYSFFAPSAGLTGYHRLAIQYGQSALNRLSDETGGRAFFQGSSFVTFDAYFERLGRAINEKGAAY
jgi:hypothetical protein